MKIACLNHVPFEGPAGIADWSLRHQHSLRVVPLYRENPDWDFIQESDLLVVMGGPMNVDDEAIYPYLAQEKTVLRERVARGKKTLGICLGAQLIASALGAAVTKNPQTEIGFFPVTLDKTFLTFHWHGDTFAPPEGATHLGSSEACRNQAFRIGRTTLGLQFHPEMDEAGIAALIQASQPMPTPGKWIQSPEQMLLIAREEKTKATQRETLDRLLSIF